MRKTMAIMAATILATVPAHAAGLDGYYPKSGIIYNVDKANDVVTVIDHNENLWTFSGAEDWEAWDQCAMIMYDNGTPDTSDDEIVAIRYEIWG